MNLKPKLIGATAVLSAGLLILASCQSETGTINGEDDSDDNGETAVEDIPGLPSSTIEEWEGACDLLNIEDAQDFFGTDDWKGDSPMDLRVGEGIISQALSCDGLINWPVFTFPSGLESTPDGQLQIFVFPLDAESHLARDDHETDGWVEFAEDNHENYDNFVNRAIDGPWDRGHLVASETPVGDLYNFQFADIDFALQGHFSLPHDPATKDDEMFEIYDEDPEDWIHFDFDRESAEQFLAEEYLPIVYQNIMDKLER